MVMLNVCRTSNLLLALRHRTEGIRNPQRAWGRPHSSHRATLTESVCVGHRRDPRSALAVAGTLSLTRLDANHIPCGATSRPLNRLSPSRGDGRHRGIVFGSRPRFQRPAADFTILKELPGGSRRVAAVGGCGAVGRLEIAFACLLLVGAGLLTAA